jgi:hypothetical protein
MSTSNKRMIHAQRARYVLLNPQASAVTLFSSRPYPGGLKALAKEILLRLINDYLEPSDAVCLGLTCLFFKNLVIWACQKPLYLICPPLPLPAQVQNPRHLGRFSVRKPSEAELDRAKLFRNNLRDLMGLSQIYCGDPSKPATRNLLHSKAFLKKIEEHVNCGCLVTLRKRQKEITGGDFADALTARKERYLSTIGSAQHRITQERRRLERAGVTWRGSY